MIKRVKDFGPDLAKKFPSLDENALFSRKSIGGALTKEVAKQTEEGIYTSTGYVTTLDIDRDRDVLMPKGIDWSEYEKNNVVLNMHNYRELPLGQCTKLIPDKLGWRGVTEYYVNDARDSQGFKNWEYRSKGFPMGRSIGFAPTEYAINSKYGEEFEKGWKDALKEWQKEYKSAYGKSPEGTPDVIITKSIAFEYSDVTVPANAGCNGEEGKGIDLILISKGLGVDGAISVDTLIELKKKLLDEIKIDPIVSVEEDMEIKEILEQQQEQINVIKELLEKIALKDSEQLNTTNLGKDADAAIEPVIEPIVEPVAEPVIEDTNEDTNEDTTEDTTEDDSMSVEEFKSLYEKKVNDVVKLQLDALAEKLLQLQDDIARVTGTI